MNVREWLRNTSPAERVAVIRTVETTTEYLYQLAGEHRRPSPKLARALEAATRTHTPDHVMTAKALRPDIFGEEAAA